MSEYRSDEHSPTSKAEIVEFMGLAAIFQVEADVLKRKSIGLKAKLLFNGLASLAFLTWLYYAASRMFADYQGATISQRYIAATAIGLALIAPIFKFSVRDWRISREIEALASVLLALRDQIIFSNGQPPSETVQVLTRSAAGWIEFKNRDVVQLHQILGAISAESIRSTDGGPH